MSRICTKYFRRTEDAGERRGSRKGVELLTYCCLGNSTKCSSSSSRPYLSLLPLLLLRPSLPAPFPRIFLLFSFSFLADSYRRAVSLRRIVGVASTSSRYSFKRIRSYAHATSIVFKFIGKFASRSRFEVISFSA